MRVSREVDLGDCVINKNITLKRILAMHYADTFQSCTGRTNYLYFKSFVQDFLNLSKWLSEPWEIIQTTKQWQKEEIKKKEHTFSDWFSMA